MAKELTLPGTPVTVIDIPTKHAVCSEVKSLSANMWTETATCRGLRLCQVRIDSLFNSFVFSIFFTLKKYPRNSWNGSPLVGVLSFPTSRKNCAREKNLFCQFPGRQVIGTFYWHLGNIIVRRKFIFSSKRSLQANRLTFFASVGFVYNFQIAPMSCTTALSTRSRIRPYLSCTTKISAIRAIWSNTAGNRPREFQLDCIMRKLHTECYLVAPLVAHLIKKKN